VHGLHVTLLVSAGLLLLGAVMALRLPRAMECGVPAAGSAEIPGPRDVMEPRVSA